MRLFSLIVALCLICSTVHAVESEPSYPYDAVVEAEDLHVRSGPGTRYYPTGRLHAGDQVKVRRTDPGGWLMIDPPEGSFSLIPAAMVEQTDDKNGTIIQDHAKVLMGGVQHEAQGVTQRELNQGDPVEILGQLELSMGGPVQKWYKIRPPQGEYRWVAGQYVRSMNESRAPGKAKGRGSNTDPLADDETPRPSRGKKSAGSADAPRKSSTRIAKNGALSHSGPPLEVLSAEREKLKHLDQQWDLMIHREPKYWQLDAMEQAYRQLQQELTAVVLQKQIDYRLATLAEHRKIYGDLADFQRIKEQTDLRDHQLSQGAGFIPPTNPTQTSPASGPVAGPMDGERFEHPVLQVGNSPGAGGPAANVVQNAVSPMQPAGTPLTPEGTDPSLPENPAGNPNPATLASGGYVVTGRLMVTGQPGGLRLFQSKLPQFMVINANNQVLAFLHATPGIDLRRYVGQEVGIRGSRWNQPGVQSPVISVTQLDPLGQSPQMAGQPQPFGTNPQSVPAPNGFQGTAAPMTSAPMEANQTVVGYGQARGGMPIGNGGRWIPAETPLSSPPSTMQPGSPQGAPVMGMAPMAGSYTPQPGMPTMRTQPMQWRRAQPGGVVNRTYPNPSQPGMYPSGPSNRIPLNPLSN